MGEAVTTVYPFSMHKDNLVDMASCQKVYDAVNELFIPLKVDASSGSSTGNSIAYSTTIDDKPMDITKKKKGKKKGKKIKKCLDHESAQGLESNAGNCQRNSQLVLSADNRSLCTLETYGCLTDATNQDGKLVAGCLCSGPLNSKQNVTCSSLEESMSRKEEPKVNEKKIARKCKHGRISDLKENLSLGDLSQYTESMTSSTSESSNGGRIDRNSYAGYSSRRRKVPSQSDVVDRFKSEYTFYGGKENGHSVWNKNTKYNSHWVKTSNHIYVPKESNLLMKSLLPNDSLSKGFLDAPIIPSAELYASSQEQLKNKQWVAHGRCSSGFGEFNSEFRQDETEGTKGLGKLKPESETLNNSKKRAGDHKTTLPRFQNKTVLPHGEEFKIQRQLYQGKNRDFNQRSVNHSCPISHVQLNLPHTNVSVKLDHALFPVIPVQPYTSMKIPRTEYLQVESLHGDNIRPDFSSRVSLQKWIPVGKKDSEVLREDLPDSCSGNAVLHVDNTLPVSFSKVDPEQTSSNKYPEVTADALPVNPMCKKNTAYNDHSSPVNVYNGIGSQMAIKTLNASYQIQIICESIQLTTGRPLAEFENFLQLASPVVSSSSALPPCCICFQNQTGLSSLCKHQVAQLSLRDVWGWYEKPGNYGLEVTAKDTDSVSFNAHFVPFLSAIQLFRHSDIPDDKEDIIELMFEYFESDPPQLRKPLYDKVRDIVKLRTSNHQLYGDPSSLDCCNLEKIHPASWYSVAWYPIYRIPEGNFRASFLTYHSLGHFVHRRSSTEPNKSNQYVVISPALGMQSYNAQGEGWFRQKVSAINSSEILKERLRTLEESALIFARGCVHKENVLVTNKQSDFEFFLSRRR